MLLHKWRGISAEIVKKYQEEGYSGMVVTDHYFSLFFEWFASELSSSNHRKNIERWLKGYYAARNEGEKLGFTVLPGAEVRFRNLQWWDRTISQSHGKDLCRAL